MRRVCGHWREWTAGLNCLRCNELRPGRTPPSPCCPTSVPHKPEARPKRLQPVSQRSNSSPFSDTSSGAWAWPASAPIASLRFNGAPLNCTDPGSGCRDKGTDRKSCNKLIVFGFDSYLPCANLYSSRFARRVQTRRAQALEVNASGVMNSSADSGGGIDESWTALYLSRTRQGTSATSKERPYRLTQQPQHEMRARSPL